jgi:glycosyltransferase involved in cell wall biosynthesis
VDQWTGAVLSAAREAATHCQWLDLRAGPAAAGRRVPVITLDVVVPTYRVPQSTLETILALRVQQGVSTQFTIVCDRPDYAEAVATMKTLQAAHRDDAMVRIRVNDTNLGAGRNRGLAESAADWVVSLDDDVQPDAGILDAYADAIRRHPRATGFIGQSVLPPPSTARQAGVHIAGVAYFWGIAGEPYAH